ncbi:MAG TPA: BTAD domain-containing putative transcriptional regulator [Streptosporangiaceae bacterium]|nr:BTAD domain-containing putative transcriptional regulator [Streptosporangiaceae bacterium]
MEFGLLGPLLVRVDNTPVRVSAGKQRVLLAAMLVRANQVVAVDDLARAVWDGSPPESARVTLQNYVKRLRQALGPTGYQRIATCPAGYLIEAAAEELDLTRFGQLRAAGRAAARGGAWAAASDQLSAALLLWRGPPLADVPSRLLTETEVPRLAEMRLDALEARIDADLHLGRHREVIAELQPLVSAEPLRERLHELLMLALYRSGQRAAALDAYRRAWRQLVDQVGIEPGPGLRELSQRILRSDPALLPAAPVLPGPPALAPPSVPAPAPPRPAMLPAAVPGFTGRARELESLSMMLGRPGHPGPGGTPVVITAIGGTAGVGKTALAVHWARQAAARFPDGQLYVNLRGFGPSGDPLPPAEALREFLDALHVPAAQIPADLEARQALYRSLLAEQRVLILLDNARDPAQVRPLLPATPGALVLITSRSELTGLIAAEGARPLSLDVLTDTEAHQLIAGRIGAVRVAAEPAAADELIALCARLPLALAITAARAAAQPAFPLAALAAELRDARGRLDALSTGEDATDVRAVLSWSYQNLPAPAARLFRLLAVHPGPDITVPAAASLAAVTLPEARSLLRELTRCHLLAEPAPGRYACHDLLRTYALELTSAKDTESERHAALGRTLDHYLHTAHGAAMLLNAHRGPISPPLARPGTVPESLDGHGQALAWFTAEHHVLLAAISQAAKAGFDVHAWQLPWAMVDYFSWQGHWHDLVMAQHSALAAAQRLGDTVAQADVHRAIGQARFGLRSWDDARAHLSRALGLYGDLGDRAGQARTHIALGHVLDRMGCCREALGHARQALSLFEEASLQAGQARALNNMGWYHARLGDYRQALARSRQALGLQREVGDRCGEARTWDSLGYAHHHLGHYTKAARCYQQAIGLFVDLGDRQSQAETLTHLGDMRRAASSPQAAIETWRQALDILEALHHPDADQVRDKLDRADELVSSASGR